MVKADCVLTKNYKTPTDNTTREHFLRGSNPPPIALSRRTTQSSMTDFIREITAHKVRTSEHLNSECTTDQTENPIKDISHTTIAQPNLLRNKSIARKQCTLSTFKTKVIQQYAI